MPELIVIAADTREAAFGLRAKIAGRALNVGIDNGFLELLGEDLPAETAAVALLARRVEPDRLAARVETHGGMTFCAALSNDLADAMPAVTDARTPTKDRIHVAGYQHQPAL